MHIFFSADESCSAEGRGKNTTLPKKILTNKQKRCNRNWHSIIHHNLERQRNWCQSAFLLLPHSQVAAAAASVHCVAIRSIVGACTQRDATQPSTLIFVHCPKICPSVITDSCCRFWFNIEKISFQTSTPRMTSAIKANLKGKKNIYINFLDYIFRATYFCAAFVVHLFCSSLVQSCTRLLLECIFLLSAVMMRQAILFWVKIKVSFGTLLKKIIFNYCHKSSTHPKN